MTIRKRRTWIRPVAYICLASLSCILFTEFTPPLLDPALPGRLPLVGALPGDLPIYWLRFALSFLLLGACPLALALALGDRPADLGLRLDSPVLRSPLFWLSLPIAAGAGAIGALSPDIAAYYPYSRDLIGAVAAEGALPFAGHAAAYLLLYYLPWELFFRGFLLLALARELRLPAAPGGTRTGGSAPEAREALVAALVLFQTLPSTMLHVGHPLSELVGAVAAGLGLGLLAWRTGSIVPGLLIHAAIGIGADALIVLRGAGAL